MSVEMIIFVQYVVYLSLIIVIYRYTITKIAAMGGTLPGIYTSQYFFRLCTYLFVSMAQQIRNVPTPKILVDTQSIVVSLWLVHFRSISIDQNLPNYFLMIFILLLESETIFPFAYSLQ